VFKINQKFLMLISFIFAFVVPCSVSFAVSAQLDDPTRPPGYALNIPGKKKVAVETRFRLYMVQISASKRSAIINNRYVEMGGFVNGAKVIGIYPSSVKLKKKGKTFTIKMSSHGIKKTKTN